MITRIPRNRRRAGGGQSNLSRSNQLAISSRVYTCILKLNSFSKNSRIEFSRIEPQKVNPIQERNF